MTRTVTTNILWSKPISLGLLALTWDTIAAVDRARITLLANTWLHKLSEAFPVYTEFNIDADKEPQFGYQIGNVDGKLHINMLMTGAQLLDSQYLPSFAGRGQMIYESVYNAMKVADIQISALFDDRWPEATINMNVKHTY